MTIIILSGCFIIIIYHLFKQIINLKTENSLLKMLLNMKVISKLCEDHPDLVEIEMEVDNDDEDSGS